MLIVDPDRDLRETLGDIVVRWGYVPLLAANGHEALSVARARSPWVVVSEILLQDLDPKDLLGELRRASENDRPVFIALTSWCRLEDRLRAGRAGFDRFLLKPADLDQLRQLLVELTPARLPSLGVGGAGGAAPEGSSAFL